MRRSIRDSKDKKERDFFNISGYLDVMRRQILVPFVVALAALSPSLSFASGSVTTASQSASRQSMDRVSLKTAQATATPASRALIAEEPYNLGKALFSGKYTFGKPKLTAANVAEKRQRLVTLQRTLPAPEKEKMNPPELAKQLTDREMNALEYYLGVRFGKFITKSPSWAKEEPPPQVAYAK